MPPTTTVKLDKFEGRPVTRTSIRLTKAGDGLSKALQIEPAILQHGQVVHIVVEAKVEHVDFKPIDDDGPELVRVHTLETQAMTIVEEELVRPALDEQADKLRKAWEDETGQHSLLDGDGEGDGE